MLKQANAGLNSEWFVVKKYSVLKESELEEKAKGMVEDKGHENVVVSVINSLEGASESLSEEGDEEGLREVADMFLTAYMKIGNANLLDRYVEVCQELKMTEDEINEKLVSTGDECHYVDLTVNLYSKANAKEKLLDIAKRTMDIYLESGDIDINTKSRLFDYIVEAYKSADNMEMLIEAGDKALKSQIEGRHLVREKDWILDAQKAYEAAGDKDKLTHLADQYVNLYLKEGMGLWLDKSIPVYKEIGVDYAEKFNHLADKIEEKGHIEIADTFRSKANE